MTSRLLALAIAVGLAAAPTATAAGPWCGPIAADGCCCPQTGIGPACAMGCSEEPAATLLPSLPSPSSRYNVPAPAASSDATPGALSSLIRDTGGRCSAISAALHAPPEPLYLLHRNLRL